MIVISDSTILIGLVKIGEKARKSAVIAGFEIMGLLGLFILAKNPRPNS